MMDDRERRLHRALIRLADAHEALRRAETDLAMIRADLGRVAERDGRSVKWLCQQINRELREETKP